MCHLYLKKFRHSKEGVEKIQYILLNWLCGFTHYLSYVS